MFGKTITAMLALLLGLVSLILPQTLSRTLLFEAGDYYLFYSERTGSDALITISEAEDAEKTKMMLGKITGESTSYSDREKAFKEAEKYDAELQFTESVAGVINYYYYSDKISESILLCGKRVNVHIALKEEGSAIGSPIIFGGY